jgi:phosphoglycerate dehydrogenase-like enzyme
MHNATTLPLTHNPNPRPRAALLLAPSTASDAYSETELAGLRNLVELTTGFVSAADWRAHREMLADCEIVISGWGAPTFDAELLAAMPKLRAVFYAGGTVKKIVTDEFWERRIALTACNAVNAIPVAEFTIAQIVLLLKDAHRFAAEVKKARSFVPWRPVAGAYGSTVGLLSLSTIGRLVAEKLRAMDVQVIAYDPVAPMELFDKLGVRSVPLTTLFKESHVVSIHAPVLPETIGLVTEPLLRSMRSGAALLNTARGVIVDQDALTRVLSERSDLFAMLDVTWPQPPPSDSPLYDLPNVVITPHIAGSMSTECRRMGQLVIEELRRYLRGESLRHAVTKDSLRTSA